MIYPTIMFVVASLIITVLMVAVVPELTKQFSSQGKTLPINTRMLIWTSHIIGAYILFWIVGLSIAGYLFVRWTRSPEGRPKWHRFVLRLPAVGPLARQVDVARFSRTLGTMLHSGVPMLRALDTAKNIMGNVILRKAIDDAKQAVTEGESLAGTLKKSGEFPATMIHMIAVGERAGQLEQMLGRVATTMEAEVETKLSRMTALLEPLMIVFMAGAVTFIVFSVLQPIMAMGQLSGPR
jgi:general secretion pathway protein F